MLSPHFDPGKLAQWVADTTGRSQRIEVIHAEKMTVPIGWSRKVGGGVDVLRLSRQIEYPTKKWGEGEAPVDVVSDGGSSQSFYRTPIMPTLYELRHFANGAKPETRYVVVIAAPDLFPLADVNHKVLSGMGYTEVGIKTILRAVTIEFAVAAAQLGGLALETKGSKEAALRLLRHIQHRNTTHGKDLALEHHLQYKAPLNADTDTLVNGAIKSLELLR